MYIDSMLHIDMKYLEEIKNDLTSMSNIFFVPDKKSAKDKKKDHEIRLWYSIIKKSDLIVPRNYPLNTKEIIEDRTVWDNPRKIKFLGTLYDSQNKVLETIKERKSCIINMPKTDGRDIAVVAGIAELSRRTIIIANRSELIDSWKDKILNYTENIPGIVTPVSREMCNNHNIIIASFNGLQKNMTKILSNDYFSKGGFFESFDVVIIDDCDRFPIKRLHEVLQFFPARIRIGLSSRNTRYDGMEKLLNYHIGEFIDIKAEKETLPDVYLIRKGLENRKDMKLNSPISTLGGAIVSYSKNRKRNKIIVDTTLNLIYSGKKPVIITSIAAHKMRLRNLIYMKDKSLSISVLKGSALKDYISPDSHVYITDYTFFRKSFNMEFVDSVFLVLPHPNENSNSIIIETLNKIISASRDKKYIIIDFKDPDIKSMKLLQNRLTVYSDFGLSVYLLSENDKVINNKELFLCDIMGSNKIIDEGDEDAIL